MKYEIRTFLRNAGAVDQESDESVEGLLLVGENPIGKWIDGECRYGEMHNYIYPAIYKGEKSWLHVEEWNPGNGYCAQGVQDIILDFETGFQRLLEHECYPGLWTQDLGEKID